MSNIDDENRRTPGDIVGVMSNPIYAIQIDPALTFDHEPILGEDEWVQVNAKLIRDLGGENYLRNLLSILKGNWVAAPDYRGDLIPPPDPTGKEGGVDTTRHADIDADYLDDLVADAICGRLTEEPNILARSAAAARDSPTLVDELRDELDELETDGLTLLEVITLMPDEWDDLSFAAQRLLLLYFVDKVVVGSPDLPLHEQVTIEWRIPVDEDGA